MVTPANKPKQAVLPVRAAPPVRRHGFLDKMLGAGELPERKILFFGPPRSGKTTFIGSAAYDERTSPVLLLDFEGGSNSLAGIPADKLTVARIREWADFNEAYDYLKNHKHGFKTVAIDSLSETHVFSLLTIVEQEAAKVNAKSEQAGDKGRKREDTTAEQADYGKSMMQIRRLLRHMRDLPMHCLFTALPKTVRVAREGEVQIPAMFGQMAEEVVGMFEVTAYLANVPEIDEKTRRETGRINRILYLQNTPGVRAGIRTGWNKRIANSMQDPTMTKLLDMLEGKPMK